MSRAALWAGAFGVVAAGAVAGAVVGRAAGDHPFVGAIAGVAFGMAINHNRKCPVCAEHLAAAQAMLNRETP